MSHECLHWWHKIYFWKPIISYLEGLLWGYHNNFMHVTLNMNGILATIAVIVDRVWSWDLYKMAVCGDNSQLLHSWSFYWILLGQLLCPRTETFDFPVYSLHHLFHAVWTSHREHKINFWEMNTLAWYIYKDFCELKEFPFTECIIKPT